ncbi:CPBP family intramembrane metalloprotease [Staphylococcus gallinarum]|nr:CPBP family intramembrane metalloprotease [Staphylococcus gallinarum]
MKKVMLRFREVTWKDFIVVVSLFLILECLSIVVMRFGHQFVEGLNSSSEVLLGSLIQLLAYMTTIFIFYFLHMNDFYTKFNTGVEVINQNKAWLVGIFIIMFVASYLYNFVVQYLPGGWGFSETQNEMQLQILFKNPQFLPFSFLLIVIAAPLVEEIIFRHLMIGELGKVFNFKVMGVISAILFSFMHVSSAASPFEFGSYFILAVALVYAYVKTKNKLIVSFSLHMLNNLVSFIITVLMMYQ